MARHGDTPEERSTCTCRWVTQIHKHEKEGSAADCGLNSSLAVHPVNKDLQLSLNTSCLFSSSQLKLPGCSMLVTNHFQPSKGQDQLLQMSCHALHNASWLHTEYVQVCFRWLLSISASYSYINIDETSLKCSDKNANLFFILLISPSGFLGMSFLFT